MQKLKHEPHIMKQQSSNGDSVSVLVSVIMLVILRTFLQYISSLLLHKLRGTCSRRCWIYVRCNKIHRCIHRLYGRCNDRPYRYKNGRYRPWMLYGAPVLAVGMVLLFSVPTGWSAGAKLAWAYVTYVIFSFATLCKYSNGTDRIFSVSISNRAYQDFYNSYCIFKPWITDIFPVRASDGILLLRLQGCNWCSIGYRIS